MKIRIKMKYYADGSARAYAQQRFIGIWITWAELFDSDARKAYLRMQDVIKANTVLRINYNV